MKNELEKVIEDIFIRTFTGEVDQNKYPYASMSFYHLEDSLRENGIETSGGFSLKAANTAYYWTGLSLQVVMALETLIASGRISVSGLNTFYYWCEWMRGRKMKEVPGLVWIPSQLMLNYTQEEYERVETMGEKQTVTVMPWMVERGGGTA